MKRINKKGGLKEWSILFMIFCMTITALVFVADGMFDEYDVDIGEEYRPVYDSIALSIESEANITDDMQTKTNEMKINPGVTSFYLSLITNSLVTVVKAPFVTLYGVLTTISIVADKMSIPTFILVGITSILMITLAITVLSWAFNKQTK